ncbi:N protein [DeBrazza's monkey arterivirus]|uniref:Nucleoprotein n=1 Tax=DeBrazza's monkey arterivirus TaxID=1965063 RepID=A0A0B6CFJ6_9NIDO|nr:N protein [DeBrazza's monkey arterivirus]AJI43736.1 N protein [DeBrazza's monkey arterivirus]
MAGKPKTNKTSSPKTRGKKRTRGNVTSKSSAQHPPRQRRGPSAQSHETHYVFAEPGDLRVSLAPQHATHIRALLLRYFDNGGGSLDFQSGRISFQANITPPKQLERVIERATSST